MKLSKHIQFLKRFLIGILLLLSVIGCTPLKVYKTPSPSFYGNIDNTSLVNGYPKQKQTWVVFSDRENNRVSPTKEEDITLVYKELKFLEPLIVLKKRKGMFKVGEYTPTSLNDGKLTLKKGKIKVKGWIPQERLLLWSKGLRSAETGFAAKAILTVSDPEVFATPNDFIENDSVIVYKTPNLSEKAKKRSIGDLVYIYKESADKEMLLIGKKPASIVDSIQSSVYGWVSKKMVSVWGERTAIQLPSNAFSADIFLHKKQDSLQSIPAISLDEDTFRHIQGGFSGGVSGGIEILPRFTFTALAGMGFYFGGEVNPLSKMKFNQYVNFRLNTSLSYTQKDWSLAFSILYNNKNLYFKDVDLLGINTANFKLTYIKQIKFSTRRSNKVTRYLGM